MLLKVTSNLYPLFFPVDLANKKPPEPLGGCDWSNAVRGWNTHSVKYIVKSSHGYVGSNQLAVIAVSKRALLPVTETLQFVTQ